MRRKQSSQNRFNGSRQSQTAPESREKFDVNGQAYDHIRLQQIAERFATHIELKYKGYGRIFKEGKDPEFHVPVISPEERALYAADPHSIESLLVKKKLELLATQQFEFKIDAEHVFMELIQHCTPQLVTILENDPSYAQIRLDRDPKRLWLLVQRVVLRGPTSNADPFTERTRIVLRWMKIKQLEDESLMDFRFRFEREVRYLYENRLLVSLIPFDILPHGDDVTPYTEDAEEFLLDYLSDHDTLLAAREFIERLDRNRYGELVSQLANDYAAGRDNYPITVSAAFNLAYAFRPSRRPFQPKQGAAKNPASAPPASDESGTQIPVDSGVALTTVPKKDKDKEHERRDYMKNVTCYNCQQKGHTANVCPARQSKTPSGATKKVTFVTYGVQQPASLQSNSDVILSHGVAFSLNDRESPVSPWYVLLDNQATVSVFGNSSLLSNIRPAPSDVEVAGVGGSLTASLVGDFPPFGTVYFHPRSIANILCFSDVADLHHVTYTDGEYRVTVRGYSEPFIFRRKDKLHVMDCRDVPASKSSHFLFPVMTVEGNEVAFTKVEVEKAKEARRLATILGFPSLKQFTHALNTGSIIGSDVTSKDVRRAEAIYGPSTAQLMGKTRRTVPASVITPEREDTPSTLANVTLCGDVFFVNGLPFLICISLRLCLITTSYLPDRAKATLWSAVKSTLARYKEFGFNVVEFRCDGEETFSSIADDLRLCGTTFNATSKSEHEPVVERAVQTLKGTARSIINSLPYKLCGILVVYLVYYATSCANMFPKRGSVADVSPRQLMMGRRINVSIEGRAPFGAFVHVHDDNAITNGMEPRTTPAILLGPMGNHQGGYRFLNLNTWKVIVRRNWTELPLPQDLIQSLNDKARNEKRKGAPDGVLEFTLHGALLPEHDLDFNDDDEEPIVVQELIGPLRQGPVEPIQHISPAPEVLLDTAAPNTSVNIADANVIPDDILSDDDLEPVASADAAVADAGVQEWVDDVDNEDFVNHSLPFHQADGFSDSPDVADSLNESPGLPTAHSTDIAPNVVNTYVPPHTYGTRYQSRRQRDFDYALVQLSGNAAVRTFGLFRVVESQAKELRQLHEKGVWHPVAYSSLSPTHKEQLLYSFCFTKEKRDNTLKSRLVSIGSKQNGPAFAGEVIDASSPTVNNMCMNIILAEIAEMSRVRDVHVVTVDIEGAYLHADMPSDRYLSLDKDLSHILADMYPDIYLKYLGRTGRLCLKLDKALYGCIESAKLFYDHLSATLHAIGLNPNPYDLCVFNGSFFDARVTVIIHVDDLLISSVDRRGVDHVLQHLTDVYHKITLHEGPILDYLGIDLDFSHRGCVIVSATRMVKETLEQCSDMLGRMTLTPASSTLFEVDLRSHSLDKKRQERFHSVVAKLLYVSKHGRPDILTAVAFLTTRVTRPSEEDERKLIRVLNYLNCHPDLVMRFSGCPGSFIRAYVDASYAVHIDGKSHSGVVVTVGDAGTVHVGSKKQKLVAKSSTEAELIALGDELSPILFANHFIQAQGYSDTPAIVFQDNQSTIALAEKGRSTSARTRHISIRYFFVKDNIDRREIEIKYKPTEDMLADFFTKPLQGDLFKRLRDFIMNGTSPPAVNSLSDA